MCSIGSRLLLRAASSAALLYHRAMLGRLRRSGQPPITNLPSGRSGTRLVAASSGSAPGVVRGVRGLGNAAKANQGSLLGKGNIKPTRVSLGLPARGAS